MHPNNYPYFVGAFDTVAALGSLAQGVYFAVLYLVGAAVVSRLISLLPDLPHIGPSPHILQICTGHHHTRRNTHPIALIIYISTHATFDFKVPGYSRREQLRTFHFNTEWKHTFYDTDLNLNIPYARDLNR